MSKENFNMRLFTMKYYFSVMVLLCLMCSVGYAQKVSSDELLKQALDAVNTSKNYPLAISLAQEGLNVSPDYTDIRVLLGRLYLLTGKNDDAVKELKKALVKQPNDIDALGYIINANYQNKNLDEAIRYSGLYLNYYPSDKAMLVKRISMLNEAADFEKARYEIKQVLKKYPSDPGIVYLHKEILFSEAGHAVKAKDSLKALNTYKEILTAYPSDTLARNQVINLETERKNYQTAVEYIDSGLSYYPNKENLMLKKLGLVQSMGDTRQAYQLSEKMQSDYPENRKIRAINNELLTLTRQNQIGFGYAITAFDQAGKNPWSVYSASYQRNEKYGALIARVNYADRIDLNGYQFEVEAYPTHGSSYSFVNFSYSNSVVFQKFRFSYSYFTPLSKTWETEIGVRYQRTDRDFFSYTGALGKYFGPIWINAKVFLTPNDGKLANSYTLASRYYFNDSQDDYFTLIGGYGFSPDDRGRNFEIENRLNMESVRVTLGYQRTLWSRNILGIFSTWNNQKYEFGVKRNEYDASISFRHRF